VVRSLPARRQQQQQLDSVSSCCLLVVVLQLMGMTSCRSHCWEMKTSPAAPPCSPVPPSIITSSK
jgi:hypothetical protein